MSDSATEVDTRHRPPSKQLLPASLEPPSQLLQQPCMRLASCQSSSFGENEPDDSCFCTDTSIWNKSLAANEAAAAKPARDSHSVQQIPTFQTAARQTDQRANKNPPNLLARVAYSHQESCQFVHSDSEEKSFSRLPLALLINAGNVDTDADNGCTTSPALHFIKDSSRAAEETISFCQAEQGAFWRSDLQHSSPTDEATSIQEATHSFARSSMQRTSRLDSARRNLIAESNDASGTPGHSAVLDQPLENCKMNTARTSVTPQLGLRPSKRATPLNPDSHLGTQSKLLSVTSSYASVVKPTLLSKRSPGGGLQSSTLQARLGLKSLWHGFPEGLKPNRVKFSQLKKHPQMGPAMLKKRSRGAKKDPLVATNRSLASQGTLTSKDKAVRPLSFNTAGVVACQRQVKQARQNKVPIYKSLPKTARNSSPQTIRPSQNKALGNQSKFSGKQSPGLVANYTTNQPRAKKAASFTKHNYLCFKPRYLQEQI